MLSGWVPDLAGASRDCREELAMLAGMSVDY
jgi:hypothetical protein